MIKRPFLWGIIAFVGGLLGAWNKLPLPCIAIVGVMGWLLIYLLMFRIKRYVNRMDYFLWGLPILILLGFFSMNDRMKPPDIDIAFEDKSECNLTGEITMIVKKSWGRSYYLKDIKVTLLEDNNTYMVEEVIVNTYEDESQALQSQASQSQETQSRKLQVGNVVSISGIIKKFTPNTNPGGFNEYLYYKSQNISYKVNTDDITVINSAYSSFHFILNNIKEELVNVYSRILPKKEAGTLMAMVLGEKYLLEDEIKSLYQENGISHILAISGLHVSMIGAAIYFILKKLRLGLVTATIISLILVYSYGILTNFSVSTNRAVVMYSILLLAKVIGKTFDILSALSLSAFLILIQNPMEIFQAGFLLSFGAVLGIALIIPCLNNLYEAKHSLLKGIYVSISAQILTLPFLLHYFFQIPIYSVFVNLILLPLTSLLMLTALLAGIVGMVSISLGVFIAGSANYILILYELVCKLGASLPGNLLTIGRPDTIRIVIYFAILLVFIISARKFKRKILLMLPILAIVLITFPKSREGLTITMLDVGQGEAIFIESNLGTTYLIDGGSSDVNQVGRYRIVPYLLSRGIDTLDYAIVTHSDLDHISGLLEIIEDNQIRVRYLLLPNTSSKDEFYHEIVALAKSKGINLAYVVSGDMIREEKLVMTLLHPPKGYPASSNNDYSTVISLKYGEFDMLLTGDIETNGENLLLDVLKGQKDQTDFDVLKVAHHGSRNSTSKELLSIIRPELSLISCAKNNRYGHPHEELLKRLADVGSDILITYNSGAITIKTDGKRVVVEEYTK